MIPINPEAIGDPNTTPVVYLGEEAGKVLGIRQRGESAPKPTGTCRRCDRVFRLTKRGGIWPHGNGVKDTANPYYMQNCPGSGQDPKEHLRMGRDYTPADVYRAMGEPVPPMWAQYEREHPAHLSTDRPDQPEG